MADKKYWNDIYKSKNSDQFSWTQDIPKRSLEFIHSFNLSKTARIIDIGGGDGKLADHLLDEGFENITVLDISEKALDKAKERLGQKAQKVHWVVSDITEFQPDSMFDVWHDRATFHFLTTDVQVSRYLDIAKKFVAGYLIIGTFSEQGPEKCSGLPVHRYSEEKLASQLQSGFHKIRCITEDHITPFNTSQNFLFCSFQRNMN